MTLIHLFDYLYSYYISINRSIYLSIYTCVVYARLLCAHMGAHTHAPAYRSQKRSEVLTLSLSTLFSWDKFLTEPRDKFHQALAILLFLPPHYLVLQEWSWLWLASLCGYWGFELGSSGLPSKHSHPLSPTLSPLYIFPSTWTPHRGSLRTFRFTVVEYNHSNTSLSAILIWLRRLNCLSDVASS